MLKARLKVSDFDYSLPKELIAQYPCANRGDSRLLVLDRNKKRITHQRFIDITRYFSAGDCLVLNNTRVISARMIGSREKIHPHIGGGRQEIFLLEHLSKNVYRVLAKPAQKLTVGTRILFNQGKFSAVVLAEEPRAKIIKFSSNANTTDPWSRLGQIPLPPYIKREPEDADKKRYQTVYAKEFGATAAPTAGLHFTKELLADIQKKGVEIVYLTLHINYGTFAPVESEELRLHKMQKEYFVLPSKAVKVINAARARGSKIFTVGTTAVRVLETCTSRGVQTSARLKAAKGWTDLFIYPPYRFTMVDCLLTNFHFPKSTLLMLVSAFAGKELTHQVYQEAIEKRYRFFSYGDAMLIL